ncbi:redoxin family protein [Mycolicibacterium austroafricanum]|nr:redoxin domain-containing protein [Mycolicibacterium austroafricanum]QZT69249.1 redoxin family protein [Mycolicibacterium austroafricanum]
MDRGSSSGPQPRQRRKGTAVNRGWLVGLAVVATVAAGCNAQSETTPSAASPTASESPIAAAEPSAAETEGGYVPAHLDFTATTVDDQQFSGQSLAGKPVAIWFWAPWCPVCQREAPMVAQAASTNPDVTFVGVGALDQAPAMREFVDRYAAGDFTQLADTNAAIWAKFGVTQQPAFAFINPDGDVDVVHGTLSDAELRERLAALTDA